NEPVKAYAPGSAEKAELKAELKRQRGQAVDIPLVIAGKHVTGRDAEPVTSPHNHKLKLAQSFKATADDVQQAIKSAGEAQKEGTRMPWEDRAAVFLKAADLLSTKYRAKMNAATMLGQSKTCYQAEIDAACELADFWRFNVQFMQQIYANQPYSPAG